MRTGTGSVLLRSLLIAAFMLGAAGCSADPEEPGTVPTAKPTATSSSPTPTATPVEAQVEAAVRAYYAELTRAAQTNDTRGLRMLMLKHCPCYRSARVIEANKRRGETTPNAKFEVVSVKVHDVAARSAAAETRTNDVGYKVLNRSGKVIDHVSADKTHLDLSLIRDGSGRWVVANYFNLEASP